MKAVKVQYTVKKDYTEKNKKNISAVMTELRELKAHNVKYSTFLLDDQKTFVHLAVFLNEDATSVIPGLESFKNFRNQLMDSIPEIEPISENITLVGSSYDYFS